MNERRFALSRQHLPLIFVETHVRIETQNQQRNYLLKGLRPCSHVTSAFASNVKNRVHGSK